MKTSTIRKTRRGRTSENTGRLEELTMKTPSIIRTVILSLLYIGLVVVLALTAYFSGKAEAGHTYNRSINTDQKTAGVIVKNLNEAVSELQKGSFDPDFYELV